jgi:DNA-binding HxlR family transcriptional regulator
MHDKGIPTPREGGAAPDAGKLDSLDDGMLLAILLDSDQPGLWSINEVVRALGSRITVEDSLMRLERDGLIHRLDQYVFPTRAAVRGEEVRL